LGMYLKAENRGQLKLLRWPRLAEPYDADRTALEFATSAGDYSLLSQFHISQSTIHSSPTS